MHGTRTDIIALITQWGVCVSLLVLCSCTADLAARLQAINKMVWGNQRCTRMVETHKLASSHLNLFSFQEPKTNNLPHTMTIKSQF